MPTSIEGPPSTEPPPVDVAAPPPPTEPIAPPPTPTPPPTREGPAASPDPLATSDNLLVKDEAQANSLRRKGIAVMVGGGIITIAGFVSTVAFTVRGTQFEGLLQTAQEDYNTRNCAYKNISEGSPCDQLSKRVIGHTDKIDFADRGTKAGGAAMAAGVIVLVAGGIIYRLGIKKLKSGDIASRFRMAPTATPTYGGLLLQGRF